jgi:nicotinate dehydrogenase subunit A
MPTELTLTVNGEEHTVSVDPSTPLLYVLRNELGLSGPKYGCGLQQCGSCRVLLDGEARATCQLPVSAVEETPITTLAGLSGDDGALHPVQEAFVEEQAAQCGYCVNGVLITAVALLEENPDPDRAEIKAGLNPVLCRCGTHARFVRAVRRAADAMQS